MTIEQSWEVEKAVARVGQDLGDDNLTRLIDVMGKLCPTKDASTFFVDLQMALEDELQYRNAMAESAEEDSGNFPIYQPPIPTASMIGFKTTK